MTRTNDQSVPPPGVAAFLLALAAFGILTLWVPAAWPATVLEVGFFALAAAHLWRWRLRLHPMLVLALAPAMAGAVQAAAGATVSRFDTMQASLLWLSAWCAAWAGLQVEDVARVRRAMVWFGFVVSCVATLQAFTSPGVIFWIFPTRYAGDPYVMGPILSRNHYSAWIGLLLPAALHEALVSRRNSFAYLSITAVMYASVIASASRAGVILATASVAAVGVLALQRGLASGRSMAGLALKLAGLLAVFTLVVGWETVWKRLCEPDPFVVRREFLQSTLAMIRERPLTGFGLGTWPVVYPAYALIDTGLFANRAHCDWLEWASEGGVPLALAMLGLALWSVRPALRSVWGVGVLTVFLHAWVDYPFSRPALAAWHFLMLGLLAAPRPAPLERVCRPLQPASARAVERPV